MSKPRIALPMPTSFDPEYNRRCRPQYAQAIEATGGEPVWIDLAASPGEIAKAAGSCRGILLPGSPADVNPQKYGHVPDPATAPADLQRENVDELLLQDAHNLHKPIFGIYYGTQSLNVWRGGTLIQNLTTLPVNHKAGPGVAVAHTATVEKTSLLSQALLEIEGQGQVPVNSSHHQAIGIAGDGLRVVARCPQDGVIEAVEGGQSPEHFVLGVQWHPERSFELSESSRSLFARFVGECDSWVERTITASLG